MYRAIAIISLCFLWGHIELYGQYLQLISGTASVLSHDVAVDPAGNAYVTGSFEGNAVFDGAGAVLSSVGLKDIFVAKYDVAGTLQWQFHIGGVLGGPGLDDEGLAISVSGEGNVFVAGYFQGEADFDPGPEAVLLTSAGFRDAFIASYTSDGLLRWAKRFGGSADDIAYGVNADDENAVYVAGLFRDEADLNGGGVSTVTSAGEEDGFVLSLRHDGISNWILPYGSSSVDAGRDVGVDAAGNVYVLGHFSGFVDFAPNSTAGELPSLNGSQDVVLASYTPVGSFRWALPLGGAQQDAGLGLAVDAAGNSFLTGHFVGQVDFDPDESNEFSLTSVGARDLYVARYNTVGAFVWARQAGSGFAEGNDIAVSVSGDVAVTGFYSGTIFPDPQSTFSLNSKDEQDVVLANYDAGGAFRWAGSIGGSFAEFGSGVAFDAEDRVYLTGFFETEADFDPGEGEVILTSAGALDAFLVRYGANGALPVSVEDALPTNAGFMVEVYPNPAQGRVHVVLSTGYHVISEIEMVDVLGRSVRTIKKLDGLIGEKTTLSFDLSDLTPGVYYVRVKGPSNTASRAFALVR